jgi:hypothetical protein
MFDLDRVFRKRTLEVLRNVGHFDSNETMYLEREVTQLRQKLFEVQFPPSVAREFAPKATDIASSAETYAFKVYTPKGAAELIAYKTGKIPRVDMVADEVLGKVRPVAAAYGWDINELREAARLGIPLSEVKGKTARSAVERALDELLAFGTLENSGGTRLSTGLNGIVNNTLVEGLTVLDGEYWVAGMDPDDMLADLNALAISVSDGSSNVFSANSILLPLSHYNLASTTAWSALTGDTVLSIFKKNNPSITSISPWHKLNTVSSAQGGADKPRAMAYQKDATVLEAVVPQEFEQMPPEMEGLEFVINCHARCGGVKIYQPLGCKYLDFATS